MSRATLYKVRRTVAPVAENHCARAYDEYLSGMDYKGRETRWTRDLGEGHAFMNPAAAERARDFARRINMDAHVVYHAVVEVDA